jgi:hypothetical protein
MKTPFLFYCFLLLAFCAKGQIKSAFFERQGYVLSYAPTFYNARIKEKIGVQFTPTQGHQIQATYSIQPREQWRVDFGLGIGYHPLQAKINLLKSQYPSLPFDLKNGRLKLQDNYIILPFRVHYYQPLAPRLSVEYQLGITTWGYLDGYTSDAFNKGSIGEVALNWSYKNSLSPKINVGAGLYYQASPWYAARMSIAYDFGITPSITGNYSLKFTSSEYKTGQFQSRGSAVKTELGLVLTNGNYIDFKEKKKTWQQRKGDVFIEFSVFGINPLQKYTDLNPSTPSEITEYTYSEGLFKGQLGVALSNHWAVNLGFSRIDSYGNVWTRTANGSTFYNWSDKQWFLEGEYNASITKRLFLKSKLGGMLLLHSPSFDAYANNNSILKVNVETLHPKSYALTGGAGLEIRLFKPLSVCVNVGYIHDFNKAIYLKTASFELPNATPTSFSNTFTFRTPTYSLGGKLNMGYIYNFDKSNGWW